MAPGAFRPIRENAQFALKLYQEALRLGATAKNENTPLTAPYVSFQQLRNIFSGCAEQARRPRPIACPRVRNRRADRLQNRRMRNARLSWFSSGAYVCEKF